MRQKSAESSSLINTVFNTKIAEVSIFSSTQKIN
jgi:predicted GTPase